MHSGLERGPAVDIICTILCSYIVCDDICTFVPLYENDVIYGATVCEVRIIQFFTSEKYDNEMSFI